MIPLWDVQISPLQTQSRIRLPGDKGSWTCWTWTRASDRARWWWWSVSQFSRSVESDSVTPWITAHQASLSITNSWSSLKLMSLSRWCHPTISSSVVPFSSCPQSLPASESFPMSQLFAWGGQSTGVSASASFPPKKFQGYLLQNGLAGSPCSPRDSQESSPTPQFKSINSSALSFLHSPTLTSIHDHWKNHSLD